MINYFNFKKFDDDYLLTNDLGRYMFVSTSELKALLTGTVNPNSDFGKKAIEEMFWYQGSSQAFSEHTIPYMRESKNYLFSATSLHIFVVTNECNGECLYCQAQSGRKHSNRMDKKTAQKAVEFALQSPAKQMTFEFQGGEPLTNFDTIKFIIEYSKNNCKDKIIEYNIVSNLTLLTEKMMDFFKENNVSICTSIDGNRQLQNINRPYKGKDSYDETTTKLLRLKEKKIKVNAIETTTKYNLNKSKELVDEYIKLGLDSIFIRPLTKLGKADKNWDKIGYSSTEFLDFYKETLDYIIERNKEGVFLSEGHSCIFLRKILLNEPVNYMELRSPCGGAIGQIAYYYDGNIYTCDEGRMLSEMGDDSFKLGNVFEDNYKDLMESNCTKAMCIASCLECLPYCNSCVYMPYCGACPVINLAQDNNIFAQNPNEYRCEIYKGILDILFEYIENEPEIVDIFNRWIM